jgi:HlyD family secretion protein
VAWLPKPVPVETARVVEGPLVVTVDEDGRTRVKDRYVVSAPLTGNLTRIELRAGDSVKQGEVLAYIVPLRAPLLDERSREIERAKAAAQLATREAERHRELLAHNVVSQQAVDRALSEERAHKAEVTSAEFAAKVATHELEMARAALGRFKADAKSRGDQFAIPSPIDGRVLKVIQESEGVVQAGAPLLEVGDPRALELVVDVLTSDAVNISPGAPVSVEQWGGDPLDGVVRLVEPSAFTRISALGVEEQRVNTIVDLTDPYSEWKILGDGYRVEARIQVYRAPKAVKLPVGALFRQDESWATFLVEDGAAVVRRLEIGRRNSREAEIAKGIAPGKVVIVHPSDRVAGGVDVAPR